MVYHSLPCNVMVYRVMSCNITKYHGIPCNSLVYFYMGWQSGPQGVAIGSSRGGVDCLIILVLFIATG